MSENKKAPRWMRLDNAGLIFPASLRKTWSNAFRISVTMKDPIDPDILQTAVDHTAVRFPGICARLRRSLFWFYLEETTPPTVHEDSYQPLIGMRWSDIRKCAIRVLYYRDRLAVEFFHSVTDGTGGMIFTKNLAAEYICLRYGETIPLEDGLKDLKEPVPDEELVDSFQEHAGPVAAPRDDLNVFHLTGETETDRFLHLTCGILDAQALRAKAKEKGVSITAYLTAILLKCILDIQYERLRIEPSEDGLEKGMTFSEIRRRRKMKPVKVQIPVNLRQLYGGSTMRNFVAVFNVGVDPRMGDYTLDELCSIVHHQMQLNITAKNMRAIFTPNVNSEQNLILKVVPLPIKTLIMRIVFDTVGESVSTICFSNLGQIRLPKEAAQHISRVEFILGSQARAPYNISLPSWDGKSYVEIVRNSAEPELERRVFRTLVKEGFHVKIENNDRKGGR